jgi:N-acetylmuramoyl-L-alanine amidase
LGTRLTQPRHNKLDTGPLVAWFARRISSPILRLRFLRAVMLPVPDRYPPRKSFTFWLLVSFPVVLLLFTTPVSAPWVRAPTAISRPSVANRPEPATGAVEQTQEVWIVEKTDTFEVYSNGLRIDNRFSIANRRRSYLVFSATRPEDIRGHRRSVPAGIVFHTTESLQVPFESAQNPALKRIGESLLTYVRHKKAYNFLIDRFGSVYRVVQESDAANHAGNSIWADPEWLYLNLNQSFLGVSFETQTASGQVDVAVNPAQVRSGDILVKMLRQRYGIPARNCVTHAQVSVNISNLLIGYHLDWASSFPFDQIGLPDNYALPLPAIYLFGLEFDANFMRRAGVRLYQEAQLSEQVLRDRADAAHLPVPLYRIALQKRYLSQLATVRVGASGTEQEE